jgi:subtilisin family serine protease
VQRPDVVAPGYGVAAALSAFAPTSNLYRTLDLVHYMRIGTSQANAHTTGALALLLQTDPALTPDTARQTLVGRARHDAFTGSVPNNLYGFGKLDANPASSAVTEVVPPSAFSFTGPYPNPASGPVEFRFTLAPGAPKPGSVRFGIFDVQGRLVADRDAGAEPGLHRVSWDGRMSDGRSAPSGVYFARLKVGTQATQAVRIDRVN